MADYLAWTDRIYAARDKLLADPKFQTFAARFPLTRPIARRRARALFDLTAGFVYAQTLAACIELRLLDHLRDGPQTVTSLAPKLGLAVDPAARLLKAAVALGLAARRGTDATDEQRYGLGMDGAALLGNPGVAAMIAHHKIFYADMRDPIALLRGDRATELSRFWPYAQAQSPAAESNVAAYTSLMSASQQLVAGDIVAAHDFSQHRHLLDAGGGDGTFLRTVAAAAPRLALTLFDLPGVAAEARKRFDECGLSSRAEIVGGDLWNDSFLDGADVISLVRVLHDHDDLRAQDLLHRIFAALPPDGTLVIAEPMVTSAEDRRVGDVYFAFYLLAMGSGRARTPSEIIHMLRTAGFSSAKRLPTARPLLCSVIAARKPRATTTRNAGKECQ